MTDAVRRMAEIDVTDKSETFGRCHQRMRKFQIRTQTKVKREEITASCES